MPPEPPTPMPPSDDGRSAMEYLAQYGLVPHIPTIRSSDFHTGLSDPFRYYLTRRLGLIPRLSWSKALSRGSWAHKAFQLDDWGTPLSEDHRTAFLKSVRARLDEIREIAPYAGLTPSSTAEWLTREARDADTAYSWYAVHRTIAPRAPSHPSFATLFSSGEVISREATYYTTTKVNNRYAVHSVIQPDLLWLDPRGRLWIVDLKTTSDSPLVRLSTCPLEFQARHYAHVIADLQDNFPDRLPEPARKADLAGVMHIAVQKPTIEFCSKDRDYTEKTRTITRGARKGETVVEREYTGEPRWENYLSRCREWLTATGEYTANAKERDADPAVNFSFVGSSLLFSRQAKADYQRDLSILHSLATRPAHPEFFPKNPRGAVDLGKPTLYAPFYLNPVVDWPGIVESLSLMQAFRDEDLSTPA